MVFAPRPYARSWATELGGIEGPVKTSRYSTAHEGILQTWVSMVVSTRCTKAKTETGTCFIVQLCRR